MRKKNIYIALLSLAIGCGMTSCEDYLDKSPEATVNKEDAFKDFRNFQGFVEEIYNCIPDKEKCNYCTSWNWGDDELFNSLGNAHMTNQVDLGNFRNWYSNGQTWLMTGTNNPTSTDSFHHSLWGHAWYCIRKCNIGLANLDKMIGTEDEKNLIAGQLYFFRAWWHFEMMTYWGGLPYIDQELDATQDLTLPRLSYQECADKAAEDFRRAADLLPINWDDSSAGQATVGRNQLRINKIMALGYLGKNYLWAGSPLMKNGAQLGGSQTYNYDETYCQKAAEAFGELLTLVENNQTQYALAEFSYSNIYDHEKAASATTCYSDIFYTRRQNWQMPGSVEAIFRGPSGSSGGTDGNNSNWNMSKLWGPKVASLVEHDVIIHLPTANLVEMYGMANGLPIDDPNSGFDPTHPFKNRDPRFYHDIVFDGFHYVLAEDKLNDAQKPYAYLNLSSSGEEMRSDDMGSRTGYFFQKLVPHTCNVGDKEYDWGSALHTYLPYMRLADIYLMYAEACAAVGGASGKSSNFTKTALDAINTIRNRCGAGEVADSYAADRNKFMDEIRRERAVELSMEGFRFNDLQRWLLLTESPYTEKYAVEFDRLENDDFYKNNDPKEAQVANYRHELLVKRVFGTKHYWFPLPDDDVYLYPEFPQNPGWE
ncbi:RagB/SusD family nutrient uptake outer membrane protein [Bacteroides caecigallinarum]|uniref:RagB/SusD family nutrient uptake outer membrane protein n=1 Tax=Bacteroides caecigallinarum TaxID=1411144 RepID=UPI00195D5CC0|nr:RagB/SusD family nutrient uptake outer membrane protein [Bacteroides caecigallinarum]MBM6881993.1 RagB/SusD family nutrient uptake outer membrane protein [Bacteroides caecigallinarum]